MAAKTSDVMPVVIWVEEERGSFRYHLTNNGDAFVRAQKLRGLLRQVLGDEYVLGCSSCHQVFCRLPNFEIYTASERPGGMPMQKRDAQLIYGSRVNMDRIELIDNAFVVWIDFAEKEHPVDNPSRRAGTTGITTPALLAVPTQNKVSTRTELSRRPANLRSRRDDVGYVVLAYIVGRNVKKVFKEGFGQDIINLLQSSLKTSPSDSYLTTLRYEARTRLGQWIPP